jgi:hypothetical protein
MFYITQPQLLRTHRSDVFLTAEFPDRIASNSFFCFCLGASYARDCFGCSPAISSAEGASKNLEDQSYSLNRTTEGSQP